MAQNPFKVRYRFGKKIMTRVIWSTSEKQARKKFYRLFPAKFEYLGVVA